jgi:glycosyltransferase involved in cell wall biosynthesis
MRILWIVNIKLPVIYEAKDEKNSYYGGGWLDRISRGVLEDSNNSVMICYPSKIEEIGTVHNLRFHGIAYNLVKMNRGKLSDEKGILIAKNIIKDFNPDIIHLQGTEFQYQWFFAKAALELNISGKLVTSIQGLVFFFKKHYTLNLPLSVIRSSTVKEIILKQNINNSIKNFTRRGKYEKETIKLTSRVLGRTSWDRACTYLCNPKATYYVCNETLREEFYNGIWQYKQCIKYRIFISQASYPLKGFHIFLEALKDIIKFYPNVTVHVSGVDVTRGGWIRGSSYGNYVCKLMKKYELEDKIYFCGTLNANQMKEELLQANVFISPSTIENSPNSLGEAMLLGVPVISSGVGGVMDLMKHGKEGYIYQSDAPYMLAYYVNKLFEDENLAAEFGKNARERAQFTHNYENNLRTLLNIYSMIVEDNKIEDISFISQGN